MYYYYLFILFLSDPKLLNGSVSCLQLCLNVSMVISVTYCEQETLLYSMDTVF